ncbi:MAG TPA: SDR family oxidoreductase [Sedimentisphaerales bacterium]|nr:SDR family oxidoreductase [Sedimentisphaerales bacterium]
MASPDNILFCGNLPSRAQPELGRILVTGATGYVGGRLVPELLARGYRVRVMVRAASDEHEQRWPGADVVVADALDPGRLKAALEGVYAAYYLLHSLLLGREDLEATEIQAAGNFRRAAEQQGVARIIYLGGLGEARAPLSPHLRSRMQVADELSSGTVPATVLRAAIIIGSGSASYEIIEHLVKNLPIVLVPHWARTRCQPIGIRDVIKYLVGVLETSETSGGSFDIGGQDVLTYRGMLGILADLLGRRRLFIPCPFSNIRFFSYCASLLTPVPAPITRCLMEGIIHEVVCQNDDIKRILPFEPLGYREALVGAMSREEQDNVYTRWSDAYPPAHELAMKLREIKGPVRYTSSYSLVTEKSAASLFRSVCKIGGKEGWFHGNWLWRLRGAVDRLLLGVGSSRGRRSSSSLRIDDVIDFWRVEDLKRDTMLLLRAEMKLPGKAWLQFRIDPEGDKNRLFANAYYQPSGVFGKPYWYMFLPFHFFIFHSLIRQIEKRS